MAAKAVATTGPSPAAWSAICWTSPDGRRARSRAWPLGRASHVRVLRDAAAVVELDDAPGALLAANLLEAPYTEAKVGRRVEVVFEPLNDEITLPQFRLAHDAR